MMTHRELLNHIKKGNFNSETIEAFVDYSDDLLTRGKKDILFSIFDTLLPSSGKSDAQEKMIREALKRGNLKLMDHWGVSIKPNDSWNQLGYGVLMKVIQEGDLDVVRGILRNKDKERGMSFVASHDYHSGAIPSYPIAIAAAHGHKEMVQELWDAGIVLMRKRALKYGDDPHERVESWKGTWGKGALMCAAECGHLDIVEMFLKMEDGKHTRGWLLYDQKQSCAPIMQAACRGHHKVVKMILDASDDELVRQQLFTRDYEAVRYPARFGHMKVLKVILAASERIGEREKVEEMIQREMSSSSRSEKEIRKSREFKQMADAFAERDVVRLSALSRRHAYFDNCNRRRSAMAFRLFMADQIAKKNPQCPSIAVLKNDMVK